MTVGAPHVCVIGAGPAGLVVAHMLHRAGVPCIVLERQDISALRTRVKAGMIEHRTVVLLRELGLADTIDERARMVGSCEFRVDGEAHLFEYGALCDGRTHAIYPQNELVGDWAESLEAKGGDVRFGVTATGVDEAASTLAVRAVDTDGTQLVINCDAVACCDGARSAFSHGLRFVGIDHPRRWLTLHAAVPPATRGTVYALHADGFAGQMQRAATRTRFMLEVPPGTGYEAWPDDRIWDELERRLAAADRPGLTRGEVIERDVLDLRVRVAEQMQRGRVYFAGDAAHLITPAGGKGMNIAIHDAVELARGLVERYCNEDDARLARYSTTRLPDVWRQQGFSDQMLRLLSTPTPTETSDSGFAQGLWRALVDRVLHDADYRRWFARAYVGIDD